MGCCANGIPLNDSTLGPVCPTIVAEGADIVTVGEPGLAGAARTEGSKTRRSRFMTVAVMYHSPVLNRHYAAFIPWHFLSRHYGI